MPLATGKIALKQELLAIYSDVGSSKAAAELAKKKAQALANFFKSGTPMLVVTFPGPLAPNGTGIGGIDKPSPGMGLDAAKTILMSKMVELFSSLGASAEEKAEKEANAYYAYYSEAMVQTNDVAPPTSGPDVGIGGIVSSSPGSGFAAGLSDFQGLLKSIHEAVSLSAPAQAKKEVEATHAFASLAMVSTQGVRAGTSGTTTGTIS